MASLTNRTENTLTIMNNFVFQVNEEAKKTATFAAVLVLSYCFGLLQDLALTPECQFCNSMLEFTGSLPDNKRHILRPLYFLKFGGQYASQCLMRGHRFAIFTKSTEPVLLRRVIFLPGIRR